MLIGRMNKRISLQQYGDAQGKKQWVTKATVWAEFKKPNLKTIELAGNIASELMREISIRYRTDVRKGWQVVWGNKIFEVQHTYDDGKSTTILLCKELVM